ncbi:MAG: response regulator transcription factor [Chloroflexi bacterium]|nr:response regulator transcription factor [Chloroflexota bacterium]
MNLIRIAVVDDQTLIREGLAALLALMPDLQVVGQAGDGQQAIELTAAQAPDVVLMDVRMPGLNGVAATREIRRRFPQTRVIVLTTFDDDEYVFQSLQAGASGYLLKNADSDHLAAAIRAVHAGDSILDPAVTQKVITRALDPDSSAPQSIEKLTPREQEILREMVVGATNAEIAARLCLSEGTVKNHISHILDKLGARDRGQAIRRAIAWGWDR